MFIFSFNAPLTFFRIGLIDFENWNEFETERIHNLFVARDRFRVGLIDEFPDTARARSA